MWFHSDSSNYGAAMAGVATSKTPCGPYTYRGSFRPFGAESRDMGVFQDSEYLLVLPIFALADVAASADCTLRCVCR